MKRLVTIGLIVGALLVPVAGVAHADSTGTPG